MLNFTGFKEVTTQISNSLPSESPPIRESESELNWRGDQIRPIERKIRVPNRISSTPVGGVDFWPGGDCAKWLDCSATKRIPFDG